MLLEFIYFVSSFLPVELITHFLRLDLLRAAITTISIQLNEEP